MSHHPYHRFRAGGDSVHGPLRWSAIDCDAEDVRRYQLWVSEQSLTFKLKKHFRLSLLLLSPSCALFMWKDTRAKRHEITDTLTNHELYRCSHVVIKWALCKEEVTKIEQNYNINLVLKSNVSLNFSLTLTKQYCSELISDTLSRSINAVVGAPAHYEASIERIEVTYKLWKFRLFENIILTRWSMIRAANLNIYFIILRCLLPVVRNPGWRVFISNRVYEMECELQVIGLVMTNPNKHIHNDNRMRVICNLRKTLCNLCSNLTLSPTSRTFFDSKHRLWTRWRYVTCRLTYRTTDRISVPLRAIERPRAGR